MIILKQKNSRNPAHWETYEEERRWSSMWESVSSSREDRAEYLLNGEKLGMWMSRDLEIQVQKSLKASGQDSKELLNKHLYDTVNHYNLNCYEVKKRQKILMDLMQTLKTVKKETQFDAVEHNDLQIIRQIENKIEKMDTKVQVAKQIYQMYQNILECLQRDAAFIPQRVDNFSAIVDAHKAELTALAQVSREAAEARKNMWIELDALEKSYSMEKKERETILSNRRKLLNLEKYALKRIDASSLRSGSGRSSASGFKARSRLSDYISRAHSGPENTVVSEINKLKELMTCSKLQHCNLALSDNAQVRRALCISPASLSMAATYVPGLLIRSSHTRNNRNTYSTKASNITNSS
ncbi:coiled-coil domain-containing protein 183-like [Heterodontus francisci]|uniref:coiled-coil domain-containing protein 183-like n=1 Tax=Heterodontus francisci TaxID=7792 RepID=UPI00355B322B